MKHNIFQKATEYKHLGKQKKRWHRAVNGMAAVVVFVTTYALILPAITMERETICGLDGQADHVHTEVCYAPEDELSIEETVSRENMILKCLPETMVHTHTEECLDENGENICGYADFVVHTHNSDCYKDGELVCLLTEVAPHVHDESCYVPELTEIPTVSSNEAELTEIPTVSSNEAELTEIPTVSGNEAESTEAVAVIDVETEEATAETESAEFEGELVCTLEEIQLHQHEEGCFDENGRWICGQVEVMEHIHDDDCFHYLTQTFTYSDNEIEATVEVVTETGIPTDTQMIFRVMDYGSEDFAVYADYAVENVDGELTALNAYEIKFISEDQELELPDAQISVQITVKEITEPEAQLMTLGLEDEGTESTEDNSSTIQLTALQQQEEGVSSGEPLNVNGEETLTVTLSLGSSRSFALATSRATLPTFTIQYYAHIDHFVKLDPSKSTEVQLDSSFWIINTDNANTDYEAGNGQGYLPENGQYVLDGTLSPVPENDILYLGLGKDENGNPQKAPDDGETTTWTLGTEKLITKVYKDYKDQYWNGMTVNDLNNLRSNNHYTLAHILTQTVEQKAAMKADESLTALSDPEQYTEEEWKAYLKYWTKYDLVDENGDAISYDLTTNKDAYDEGIEAGKHMILITEGMTVRLGYDVTELDESYDAAFFDYDISKGTIEALKSDGTSTGGFGTVNKFKNNTDTTWKTSTSDAMLLYTRDKDGAKGINSPQNYVSDSENIIKLAFGNANTYTGLEKEEGITTVYTNGEVTEETAVVAINRETGITWIDSKPVYTYSFLGCSYGIVSGYDYETKRLTYGKLNKTQDDGTITEAQIVAPDLFSLNTVDPVTNKKIEGKTVYDDSSLIFSRVGDTYTLSSATVTGYRQTATGTEKHTSTVGDLDAFTVRASNSAAERVVSNNFWPLDDFITDYTTGHDFKFLATAKDENGETLKDEDGNVILAQKMSSLQTDENGAIASGNGIYNETETMISLPLSDDGENHNNYFGMNFSIDFSLDGNYVGPLEYLFYGDDDLWVFLTDKSTGKSQLVCDIGGVHGSVGEFTDLWDWIPKETDADGNYITDESGNYVYQAGDYALTFFYTERGASGSSCYMQFTLPNAIGEPIKSSESGSLKITKAVPDAEKDAEDTTGVANISYEFGIQLPTNDLYKYTIYDIVDGQDDSPVSVGTLSNPTSLNTTSNRFYLKKDQYIIIEQIPIGADVSVWEVDGENYDATWTGSDTGIKHKIDENTEYDAYKATITTANQLVEFTCTNELQGSLTLTKQLEGDVTATDTEFTFEIQVVDNGQYITTTHQTVKSDGTEGSITFESAGDGTSQMTKATVNLKAGESITIKELPAGATWTIKEINTDGYVVSNTVGEVTENDEEAEGTVIFGNNNSVTFINKTTYMLPNTGGMGTNLYTIGGLMLMFGSICFMYKNLTRRKEEGL